MTPYAVGDIHGAYHALQQVLERSPFDSETDRLICLGDVCDGWSQTRESIDLLLSLPHLILILGNHDVWTREWMGTGETRSIHLSQGGLATVRSYRAGVPPQHLNFLSHAQIYFIDEDQRLFVHGGFDPTLPMEDQPAEDLIWDRSLYRSMTKRGRQAQIPGYSKVFIGHTPTIRIRPDLTPVQVGNLINLDQGAGWNGRLTLMNVDSGDYWQSDLVTELYPGEPGRMGI